MRLGVCGWPVAHSRSPRMHNAALAHLGLAEQWRYQRLPIPPHLFVETVKALPQAGFPDIAAADGAFYLYADVGGRTDDSVAFCARILAEAGVAISPGVDFDRTRGRRTVRFSYCGPEADMAEAAERLARWG